MTRLIICLLLLLLPRFIFSQYENLLHKSYAENIKGYSKLYIELINLKDSAIIQHKILDIKRFAKAHDDTPLELEMDLFMCYHNIEFKKHRNQSCIDDLNTLILSAEKAQARFVKIRAIRVLANYYWVYQKNYERAFEQYLLLDKEVDKVDAADYPEKPMDLVKIGEAYYFFQDYNRAEVYFKKAIAVPENDFNTMTLSSARNTLGLCYQKQKNFALSNYYFNLIIQTTFQKPKEEWVRIATGNLGYNYYLQRQYNKALPFLEEDFVGAVRIEDYGPAAGAAIPLADIYLSRGEPQKSWYYIEEARRNIEKCQQTERLQYLYPVISKWYGQKGDQVNAARYLDLTIASINAYQKQFSALKMMQASQKISLRVEALNKARAELELQRKNSERNLWILLSTALAVIMLVVYRNQHNKRLLAEASRTRAENELSRAKEELDRFIQKVNEQNLLAESIRQELDELKEGHPEKKQRLEKTIAELRSVTILTGDDWLYFRKHFATVFPEFEAVLKKSCPAITESELRYLMLVKLQLSHKEMAQMLGISTDGVRVTWNRVRKKLNGSLEDTPQTLLEKAGV